MKEVKKLYASMLSAEEILNAIVVEFCDQVIYGV